MSNMQLSGKKKNTTEKDQTQSVVDDNFLGATICVL